MNCKLLYIPLAVLFLLHLPACKSKNKKEEPKDYLDVTGYLRGQLKYIDSEPFAFLKFTKRDSVLSDSQFLKKEEVQQIAESFLTDDIKKGDFEKNYTETSFADETLDLVTITYNANKEKFPVSRIDVYVNPEKERISQLYIVKTENKSDSSVTKQLLWRHNKSFTLITSVSKNGQPEKTITEKVVWDDRED